MQYIFNVSFMSQYIRVNLCNADLDLFIFLLECVYIMFELEINF